MTEHSVRHDRANQRFEISTGNHTAVAEYEVTGDRMIFTHTWVPEELRGQGIAAQLIQRGLEFARQEKKKVIPQCSYVEVFIKRHQEFSDLL